MSKRSLEFESYFDSKHPNVPCGGYAFAHASFRAEAQLVMNKSQTTLIT